MAARARREAGEGRRADGAAREAALSRVRASGVVDGGADRDAIVRHGTGEQKERLLPLIAAGRLPFYLGYSEPEVGSDLANLRTRAVRDGDDWIVNGQKLWGTGAEQAGYCWLATRTDAAAEPPHAGITVFLFPVPRPGWEL